MTSWTRPFRCELKVGKQNGGFDLSSFYWIGCSPAIIENPVHGQGPRNQKILKGS